jgi:hypothetical protein
MGHDPSSYKIGDPIYMSFRRGWSSYGATKYVVKRVSPKGQITAENGTRVIRISASGYVIGQSGNYANRVVSTEQAKRYAEEAREEDLWDRIRVAAARIEVAARKHDVDTVQAAMTDLASAMSAGTAETVQQAQGDSPPARAEGDAQNIPPNPTLSHGEGA